MGRKHNKYTALGAKIASLADNQVEIAKVLDLTQQSVSGKLQGKIAVLLSDLEKLAEHYAVPLLYFVEDSVVTAADARKAQKMIKMEFQAVEEGEAVAQT